MPLEVREQDISGVGRRYEIDIDETTSVAVLIHSGGRRELFYRDETDSPDYRKVFDLSDEEARTLGLFLVGAYYQPIATKLGAETETGEYIEWYTVDDRSGVAGVQRNDIGVGSGTGATLLAVERDGEVESTVPDEFTYAVGDRLIVLGSDDAHRKLTDRFDSG